MKRFVKSAVGFFGLMSMLLACKNPDPVFENSRQDWNDAHVNNPPLVTFLDSLTDSLRPQKVWIKDNLKPIVKYIPLHPFEKSTYMDEADQLQVVSFPQVVQRQYLKNEKGEAIFDAEGRHYYLGEGGISQFTSFTTDEGLGLDNITSSILDSSGNLWFGTWGGGISKFDGLSFTNFTTAHGLSNNLVHCIAEDHQGNIWIGTDGGGVSIYDGYAFTTKTKADGLANDVVYGITTDQNGNIWVAAGDGGASKFDGKEFVNFTQEDGLPSNVIIKIIEDNHGNIWFGTGSNGVSRYDGNSFTNFKEEDGLSSNFINCIFKDSQGSLWFGTAGGGVSIYRENHNSANKGNFINYSNIDGLVNNDVWDIKEDLDGKLWFATEGGVSSFDGQSFKSYTYGQGLAKNAVFSITVDHSGNLWLGTAGGGVSLYKGAAFTNFTSELGLVNNIVYGITEDNTGNFWFATDGGGVSKYDGKAFTNYTTAQGLPNQLVISAYKDQKGQLWFGTGGGGIALYNEAGKNRKNASFTTFNFRNGLPNDIIYAIIEDRSGNLWIGTGGSGLVKFDWNNVPEGQAGFTTFSTEQGLAGNTVYSILEDRKGNLWIGTGGGGVSKFDGKSFTNYTTKQGLSNDIIWSIMEDAAGNLWFGTQGGGISRLDGESLSTFTKREGLFDDTVYDILEDQVGNIFIGTNRGFTVIPSAVATLPFQELRENLEYYNTLYGFPVKDVNKGIYLDSEGKIWVGNGSDKIGLVKFDYKVLRKNKKRPTIKIKQVSLYEKPISWISIQSNKQENAEKPNFIIDEIRVFGRELSPEERKSQAKEFSKIQFSEIQRFENFPKKLSLPYSQNQITLGFGTDELVRPNLMEYKYILEGYHKNWSPVIKSNSVTFGNLWEGDYVFKVMARYSGPSEGEGMEWSEAATYHFTILPPIHRTWWSYLIYFIIVMVVINRVHIFQKNKTIRRERDRNQQKELEQAKAVEKAYQELQMTQGQLIQQEKLASLGQLTAGIAHEIQNPLNFVNNFSEVSAELVAEIQELRLKALSRGSGTQDPGPKTEEDEILEDIKQNLEKIQHHGKRADAIVKGMLAHSRNNKGEKELTDINDLADEYLRLSYHGLRAKDKSFKANFKTDFDPNLPKVLVVPQDLGRVLLNLINNAFQACVERHRGTYDERSRSVINQPSKGSETLEGYQPLVTVATKNLGDNIEISVKDNGSGIPDAIKDKIFQPFFTTKPSGQGTGLGLSLSYDIIKAHGGELKVESIPAGQADKEGSGTTFKVKLPLV